MRNDTSRAVILAVLVVSTCLATPVLAEDEGNSLLDALGKGDFSLGLRYRFETVDQDGFDDDANASTLRTTLAYRTLDWHGLAAFVEVEDVHALGLENSYNNRGAGSLFNGVSDRPVIADPELTELNQVFLAATCARGVLVQAGRQEVLLGNQRFVGNVGWRQNHQSFDAARLDITAIADTTLTYAYVDRAHRIFGDSKPMASHLLEAEHRFTDVGTLRVYGYLLDYHDVADLGLSTATYGASFDGSTALGGDVRLRYRAELAEQSDAGDNPSRVEAGYLRAGLGVSLGRITLNAGYELLEGTPEDGSFTTPLATLHGFNGWADVFLATPEHGLEDVSLAVEAQINAGKLAIIWHEFAADSSSADYGSELDALAVFTLPWKQQIGLKAALYDADSHGVDTDKIMVWTAWSL